MPSHWRPGGPPWPSRPLVDMLPMTDRSAGRGRPPPRHARGGQARPGQGRRHPASARRPRPSRAATDPVARVLVDLPLAHLDRPFDYLVPASMAEAAVPGARVKVRFAGQDVDGFLVERGAESDHTGRLQPLRRVVSPEPVLSPQVAELTRPVAERYAGTRADVLRLAVPPRHATDREGAVDPAPDADRRPRRRPPRLGRPPARGRLPAAPRPPAASPRAVWTAAPGTDWPRLLAHAAAATYAGGRGAPCSASPTARTSTASTPPCTAVLGEGHHVALTADAGPAARYRDFLAVSARRPPDRRRHPRRRASRPVHDLGLVAIWDDGDDLHAEPRAPYPHTRETLLLRAEQEGTAALVGGFAPHRRGAVPPPHRLGPGDRRSPRPGPRAGHGERRRGRATPSSTATATPAPPGSPPRPHQPIRAGARRAARCWCRPLGSATSTSLACERCRTPARCAACAGPLAIAAPAARRRRCRWCGTVDDGWACTECGHRGLRAPVLGDARTAEELGRAFPGTAIRQLQRRPRPGHRRRPTRDRGRHPRRRARRRGAATPPWSCSTPGSPLARGRPARRRGGRCGGGLNAAALVRPGRSGARRRRPRPSRPAGAGPLGPARASPSARPPSGGRPTCRRPRGWPRSPASPGAVDDALTLLAAPPSRRGARSRRARRRRVPGRGPGSPRARARRCPRRSPSCSGCAPRASWTPYASRWTRRRVG